MSGKFVVSDALPFMRWLDIGGDERSMKKIAKELDVVAQGWLEEHKRKRDSQEIKKEENFMYVMLSILGDTEQYLGRDVDTINKAICLSLILGAADTTTVTLTWVMSLLLNHRDILNKAQNELDIQGFNFATPSNEPVDMGEGLGLTMEKSQPFEVLVTPRLSAAFYG
ncbi:hypothetical protein AB3S75_015339 [Citrus x aurantiifolia]